MSFGDDDSDDEQMEGSEGAITFSKEEKEATRRPWRNALIVKLLERPWGTDFCLQKLNNFES